MNAQNKNCYRIVRDKFGYEVQKKCKFLFWYFWRQETYYNQYKYINTFDSIELAKNWIDNGLPKHDIIIKKVVWQSDCNKK